MFHNISLNFPNYNMFKQVWQFHISSDGKSTASFLPGMNGCVTLLWFYLFAHWDVLIGHCTSYTIKLSHILTIFYNINCDSESLGHLGTKAVMIPDFHPTINGHHKFKIMILSEYL